jgi:hypothetical protein
MTKNLHKIAAGIALVIGLMAIVAGGQVLFAGKVMDYYVIDWLPAYNFIAGLFSAGLVAPLLWRGQRLGDLLAGVALGVHTLVMLVLLGAYRDVVAPDSLVAMTVRITAYVLILALLYFARRARPLPARQS